MQRVNITKSGSVVTLVATGDKSFTVAEYPSKYKFSYDTLGNVLIEVITNPNTISVVLLKITDVSFAGVACADYDAMELKVQSVIHEQTIPDPTPAVKYTANVKDYGAIGDGVADDTAAFILAVATLKDVEVPIGDFLLSASILLNAGQKIFGHGYNSNLKTVTHGNNAGYFTCYSIIVTNTNCTVSELRFTGDGSIAYPGVTLSQNGIQLFNSFSTVFNCYFLNLRGAGIWGMHFTSSFDLLQYNKIIGCTFSGCTVGFLTYVNCEFNEISACIFITNIKHIVEQGANQNYNGVQFLQSGDCDILGNGANSDHSSWTGCSFGHNSSINVNACVVCTLFSGCNFFSSNNLNITNSDKVMIIGCGFNNLTVINITSVSALKTQILSCYSTSGTTPTVNIGGAAVVTQINNLF